MYRRLFESWANLNDGNGVHDGVFCLREPPSKALRRCAIRIRERQRSFGIYSPTCSGSLGTTYPLNYSSRAAALPRRSPGCGRRLLLYRIDNCRSDARRRSSLNQHSRAEWPVSVRNLTPDRSTEGKKPTSSSSGVGSRGVVERLFCIAATLLTVVAPSRRGCIKNLYQEDICSKAQKKRKERWVHTQWSAKLRGAHLPTPWRFEPTKWVVHHYILHIWVSMGVHCD